MFDLCQHLAPVRPVDPACWSAEVVRRLEDKEFPSRDKAAGDFGLVIDKHVATHQCLVLGEHDSAYPVGPQVVLDPLVLLGDAVRERRERGGAESGRTVKNLMSGGKLAYVKVGRATRVDLEDINQYVTRNRRKVRQALRRVE